jgi:phage-related protein
VFADEVGKWIPAGIAVGIDKNAKAALNSVKNLAMNTVGSARAGLNTATTLGGGSVGGGVVNNFTQVINSPKQLSRLDIYRQSKNLLGYAGGGF